MKKFFLATLLGAMALTSATAANVRATFEIGYESGFFSDKPNAETRQKILPLARQEVWRAYLGRQDSSTLTMVEKNKDLFNQKLQDIVTDIDFVDEQVMTDTRRMKFVVRAVVNDNMVNSVIASASGAASSGEGSLLGFLILPRLQSEAKAFDAKVAKKASASVQMVNEQVSAEQIKEGDSGVAERSVGGDKVTMAMSAKTSGSTIRKSQVAKWRLGDAKDVDASISKVLTEAGYEPASYADIAGECGTVKTQEVRQDLLASETAELSDDIRKEVFTAGRKCELRFFAVGTLDFDSIEADQNSGGVRARASVNVQVYDLKGRLPRKVASVGPVDYYGVGPQEDGARADALKISAREAALVVVNQLRAKGLQ